MRPLWPWGLRRGLGPASGASRERAGRRGFCPGPWSRSCAQGLGNGWRSRSVGSRPAPGPGFGEGGRGPTLGSALSSPSSDPQAVLTPPHNCLLILSWCPRRGWGTLCTRTWPRGPWSPHVVCSAWFQVGLGLRFLDRGVSRVFGEGRGGQVQAVWVWGFPSSPDPPHGCPHVSYRSPGDG